jgi:hypothetical protein
MAGQHFWCQLVCQVHSSAEAATRSNHCSCDQQAYTGGKYHVIQYAMIFGAGRVCLVQYMSQCERWCCTGQWLLICCTQVSVYSTCTPQDYAHVQAAHVWDVASEQDDFSHLVSDQHTMLDFLENQRVEGLYTTVCLHNTVTGKVCTLLLTCLIYGRQNTACLANTYICLYTSISVSMAHWQCVAMQVHVFCSHRSGNTWMQPSALETYVWIW